MVLRIVFPIGGFLVAAGLGFEPKLRDPKSLVLPLHYPAK